MGNIVGSNIFNLGFILGGCAVFRAIPIVPTLLWRDGAFLAGGTVLLALLVGWDLRLTPEDGALLLFLLFVYLIYLFRKRSMSPQEVAGPSELALRTKSRSLLGDIMILALGLVFVIGGSHLLVDSASALAALSAMVFMVLVMMRTGWRVSRPEGAILVVLALARWGLDFSARGL